MTVKDLHSQNQEELIEYAKALGLDSQGPKKVVFDRIVMFLKEKGEYQPPSDKRKKRSKKKKSIRLPDALDAADTTEPQEVEVEVVQEEPLFKNQKDFQEILNRFQENTQRGLEREEQDDMDLDEDDEEANLPDREELAKSKKKLAKLNRMTVAELKQMVKKPEVVEWIDVTGSDPLLLVQLKSTRNTAPVPIHWAQKRKYLQGKRGMEKPPFELPEYIKATGIMQMRQAHQGAQSMTGKLRERHHPKLGRLDIDYEKLHDAFFKYQTKPAFSCHGDVYYEGKEFETRLRMRRPGVISDELKDALNIPPGAPPPWLINMQRYGPPPSYPQLKIPGLNAPIPQGAQWGFHPGGWGKPPTDENNQPLYGDVFGTTVIVPAQVLLVDVVCCQGREAMVGRIRGRRGRG
jgi:splicing factor 3B subunit 2